MKKLNKLGVENSLYNNIREKAAKNKKTGATPKKPTKAMLMQEKKQRNQQTLSLKTTNMKCINLPNNKFKTKF